MTWTTTCLSRKGLPKKAYRSQAKARQAAIKRAPWVKSDTVRPYQCPRCRLWHIATTPYSERGERADRFRMKAGR